MRAYTLSLLAAVALGAPAVASEVETEPMLEPAAETLSEAPEGVDAMGDPAAPMGYVARSAFTTAVVDREPSDSVEKLGNDHVEVAYFTELRDMAGTTVVHRWEFDGEVKAEVPFSVGGPRWRTHSTKLLDPSWVGTWTVSVIDGAGQTLHSDSFTYAEVAEARPVEPAEAAPPAAPAPDEPASESAGGGMGREL